MRDHWLSTSGMCGLTMEITESVISELVRNTPDAVDKTASMLPDDFPVSVSDPVFSELNKAAERLKL